ncbi:MAG: hypothetical protein MK116_04470 [Phycisphaerales bacterium]|nr:hypothetical protein [Phycisphaerales bacterium]
MSRIAALMAFSLSVLGMLATTGHAEVQILQPLTSARTSPSDCWGCCCGTSSLSMNPSSISINTCTYQGGYCMGDKHQAAWIYQVPDLAEGESIDAMVFTGNRSGGYGSGAIYMRWVPTGSLTATSVNDTISNADAVMYINWPGSYTYTYNVPLSVYANASGGYLMVVAAISNTYSMNLVNSGTSGARIVMHVDQQCRGDYDGDGTVDVDDLLSLIGVFGEEDPDHDLTGDNEITVDDILLLLGGYGGCA